MLAVMGDADSTRGRIYGFHRAMDHAGAVVGPLAATAFLFFYPGEYRTLFALTIIPGAIAVALLFLVKEDDDRVVSGCSRTCRPQTGVGRPSADLPIAIRFRAHSSSSCSC